MSLEADAPPIRTTCPYCGVGCGVLATRRPDGSVDIAGDPEHPANRGRLCSKGSALGETLGLDGRLLEPQIEGREVSWDTALGHVAERFCETIIEHGRDSVAFYVSGQLLTEDYYVANKLMKGFIGSGNIDTNSRLCMASAVAGHKRAFGSDTVPGTYADLDEADLVVLVGSNLAWCHPVLFQRLLAARERRGTRIVVIDPRRTVTAQAADLHLPLAPGSDVPLYLGLLAHLAENGCTDTDYVAQHTTGIDAALIEAARLPCPAIAAATGLAEELLQRFFRLFATTERSVTIFSQGVNQSSAGTDKVNAIINCHLLTGRIGKPGAGPFSITGQPNAMGGREVGGLANMLAAHLEIENPDHRELVQRFWQSPRIARRPGLKAVELFEAVRDRRIKALWIMATNPVDSLPEADLVRQALDACPFVVVSDIERDTDTTAHAHVLLPAAGWGEKDGTVTNSERRISRQRPFLPLPGNARPDWWIVSKVAARMGYRGFDYSGPGAIFAEHAALSGLANDGRRAFDISAHAEIGLPAYNALVPFQWPAKVGEVAGDAKVGGEKRFFAEGGFFTPDRRARFVATPSRSPRSQASDAFPLALNTGRVRDQWHTMTRTGRAARLSDHAGEPFIEIHPDDARACGIAAADLVEVESPRGRVVLRALISDNQRPGSVFAPIHWTDRWASSARIDSLVASHVDPVSGQPELKFTPVAVRPFEAAWFGFAVCREKPQVAQADYWALARAMSGYRVEMAGLKELPDSLRDPRILAATHFGDTLVDAEILSYADHIRGEVRLAAFREGRLAAALFVAREAVPVSRSWMTGKLGEPVPESERLRLLAGRAGDPGEDKGAIVCACMSVGSNQIARAVAQGARDADAIGLATGAGTNCGSCRSEMRRFFDDCDRQKAG